MKKLSSLIFILTIILAFCACTKMQTEQTDPSDEVISTGDTVVDESNEETDTEATNEFVSETESTDSATHPTNEAESQITDTSVSATLPIAEQYTFTAELTKNKPNFVFEGEKKQTLTCNKIIMKNKDGVTELAISFAEDGSGLTVFMLSPDGTKNTTLARFDKDGRLVGIFNGSGAYTDYTYGDHTCIQQSYDANGVQFDYRKYYYDENEITKKVERGDGTNISETYDYTVDSEGKVTSLRVKNDTGYLLYEYTYNEQGLAERRRIEENDTFYGIQLYTYDENGKRDSYSFRNDENGPHELDITVYYNNVYDADGTYLGTAEYDSETGEVYIAVAYDYVTTEYPHYSQFLEDHFMTY